MPYVEYRPVPVVARYGSDNLFAGMQQCTKNPTREQKERSHIYNVGSTHVFAYIGIESQADALVADAELAASEKLLKAAELKVELAEQEKRSGELATKKVSIQ